MFMKLHLYVLFDRRHAKDHFQDTVSIPLPLDEADPYKANPKAVVHYRTSSCWHTAGTGSGMT